MSAKLYLIGVGPGDPELLTLKAARLLADVPVIVYPQKRGENSLALEIAKSCLNPHAELIALDIPMLADPLPAQKAYDQLAKELAERLHNGLSAAFLCEGDPLFYGSAINLISRFENSFPIEIVPGITSLTASAAVISRPLAIRNDILKVLPAPLDNQTLGAELATAQSVAIIKLGRHFQRVRDLLVETGWAKNAMVVEHATSARQKLTPLNDYPQGQSPYFSTILCSKGNVA